MRTEIKLKLKLIISSFAMLFIASAVIVCCAATSALAQSAQVFVSARNGVDAGNCAVAAPCRTVNYALTQVQEGGQALIVDSGDYDSSIEITKTVTIAAAPGVAAVFSAAVTNGTIFSFNYGASLCTSAGECKTLVLRNLIFDGQGVTQDAVRPSGIRLLVEDCAFTRFKLGVYANGPGLFQFKNCVFQSLGTGLYLAPNGSARPITQAVVEGCRFESLASAGIDANTGPVGGNGLKVVVRDSLFDRATDVAVRSVASTGGSIQVDLERCEIMNSSVGIMSASSGAVTRVSNSTIVGNSTGLSAALGGSLLTRGNNTVENNTTNGVFTGTFLAK
jgi:hypothetical protein